MTTKHTPGPWTIDYNDSSNPIKGADNQVVARVAHLAAWRHPLEAEANARLIASAPEMKQALEDAPIHRLGESFADFLNRYKAWYVGNRREAIAKAEGRE